MDLRDRTLRVPPEIALGIRDLQLDDYRDCAIVIRFQDEVQTAVARFPLGRDPISAQYPVHHREHDVLVRRLVPQREVAPVGEDGLECRLHGLRISLQDGSVETVEQVASDASAPAQEGVHDTHDLPVRDGQLVHPVPYGNGVEISCHDHERKQIVGIAQSQLVVAHRLMEFGSDGAAVDQVGHRLPPYGSCPVEHPSHGGVPAGIPPVAVWLEPPLDAHHDTERVIHLYIAETIPVVPVAKLLELLGMSVIGEDVPDLAFGESEPLVRFRRECRVDRRIVQSGEEVRFGDLHHTGHVRHLHVVVALQRGREEAAHEGYDLLLKVRIERVRDGAIVFVDEDHGHHPVMVFQENAKLRNRGYERGFIGFAGKDAPDHSLILVYQIL